MSNAEMTLDKIAPRAENDGILNSRSSLQLRRPEGPFGA